MHLGCVVVLLVLFVVLMSFRERRRRNRQGEHCGEQQNQALLHLYSFNSVREDWCKLYATESPRGNREFN